MYMYRLFLRISIFIRFTTVLHYRLTDKTILILISISKYLLCIFFDLCIFFSLTFGKRPKDLPTVPRASIIKITACEGTKLSVLFRLRTKFIRYAKNIGQFNFGQKIHLVRSLMRHCYLD